MATDLSIIDTFLSTFAGFIDSGFGLVQPSVAYLTSTLVAIDMVLAGLFWALVEGSDVIEGLISKILYVFFFALLLNNFRNLSTIIFDSFARLGLIASGSAMTANDLMRPGFVAQAGFGAGQPILDEIGKLGGFPEVFVNLVQIFVLSLSWLIVLLAFFVMAVQLFVTILEFKLTTLAGFVLVPFALFKHTAFLAERVLGAVMTAGIKLMVLAIITGIGSQLFAALGSIIDPAGATLQQAASLMLGALALFGLSLFGPGIAAGLISGAPQLGAGSAAATVVGAGAALAAGGYAARGGAKLAASAGGGAIKAAASTAGFAGGAYQLGQISAGAGATGWRSAAAGAGGIARAGARAAAGGVRAAAKTMTSPMTDAAAQGRMSAFTATGGKIIPKTPTTPPSTASTTPASSTSSTASAPATGGRSGQFSRAARTTMHSVERSDAPAASTGPKLNPEGEQ